VQLVEVNDLETNKPSHDIDEDKFAFVDLAQEAHKAQLSLSLPNN
jgi:hypothetical protein